MNREEYDGLTIQVDDGQLKELAAGISSSLSALEHVAEFPLHSFHDLGFALAHDVAIGADRPASSAGNSGIVLRVGLHMELFATALAALERYVCHERCPSLG